MTENYFRLTVLLVICGVYIFDFIPIMYREVKKPSNPVRKVSYWIFTILIMSVVSMLPSILYQSLIILEKQYIWLRGFVTVTATITMIVNFVLLGLILHYKWKE